MDSTGTEQPTTTSVRRVAIIGSPPGLGLRPTLLASSPHLQTSYSLTHRSDSAGQPRMTFR